MKKLFSLFLITLTLFWSASLLAYPTGISTLAFNAKNNGCNDCHKGGPTPTVTLSLGASVIRGQSLPMTLTVTGGAAQRGGLNVSIDQDANIARLSAGSNENIRTILGSADRDEITHNDRLAFNPNLVIPFELQTSAGAPCDSLVGLNGWGMSAGGSTDFLDDLAARSVTAVLIVCDPEVIFFDGFE